MVRHADSWKQGEPTDDPSPALKGTPSPSEGEREREKGPSILQLVSWQSRE